MVKQKLEPGCQTCHRKGHESQLWKGGDSEMSEVNATGSGQEVLSKEHA